MPDEVESMAYRYDDDSSVPWHGLGTPIDHDATPEEMLVASGLDWTVSKRPLWTPKEPTQPPGTHDGLIGVPDYFMLVRDSDNKILGPSGKDYVPIQNSQAFTFFKKFSEAGQMRMETAGSLQEGKQVWVLAKLAKSFVLPGDDAVNGYLLLSSPHIWGRSFSIKFVTIRVVCMNTFTMAMNEARHGKGFRMPHIRAFDAEVVHEAEVSLGIATELFDDFEKTAKKLAETKIDPEATLRYVADIFQPKLLEEHIEKAFYKQPESRQAELIMSPKSPRLNPSEFKRSAYDVLNSVNHQPGADLKSSRGTVWGVFNAITYYSDFLAGRDRDNAVYSTWFGPKAATKAQALRRAIQLTEVVA